MGGSDKNPKRYPRLGIAALHNLKTSSQRQTDRQTDRRVVGHPTLCTLPKSSYTRSARALIKPAQPLQWMAWRRAALRHRDV